ASSSVPSAPTSIEAMLESLDPGSIDEATRAGPRPDADALPKVNKVPALSALVPTDDAADETRSHARADLPGESCSDPEFEKFRAARATGRHTAVREPGAGAPEARSRDAREG